ncbi:hypothetical protein VNO77_07915 [Canavalia gladiata]|uniref:Uncharacterized protein n=1 Tax=Canavalia gladiata TaxID=3824 RepID=A0AAN9QW12_CANGL
MFQGYLRLIDELPAANPESKGKSDSTEEGSDQLALAFTSLRSSSCEDKERDFLLQYTTRITFPRKEKGIVRTIRVSSHFPAANSESRASSIFRSSYKTRRKQKQRCLQGMIAYSLVYYVSRIKDEASTFLCSLIDCTLFFFNYVICFH